MNYNIFHFSNDSFNGSHKPGPYSRKKKELNVGKKIHCLKLFCSRCKNSTLCNKKRHIYPNDTSQPQELFSIFFQRPTNKNLHLFKTILSYQDKITNLIIIYKFY